MSPGLVRIQVLGAVAYILTALDQERTDETLKSFSSIVCKDLLTLVINWDEATCLSRSCPAGADCATGADCAAGADCSAGADCATGADCSAGADCPATFKSLEFLWEVHVSSQLLGCVCDFQLFLAASSVHVLTTLSTSPFWRRWLVGWDLLCFFFCDKVSV